MKFLSVKILGFKSFLEPTEISLKSGLTGVVGPNGCGKSNIAEAIKWVMGENSAKQMRSNEMNNVIFSGTDNRPSRNFAEVTIRIDNSEKKAPYPFTNIAELEIGRKIERDKGSIYKINGKVARARDIQLIFADTGTGSRSSSIVGQGKISEIIEAKPEIRRSVIEEAANITGLHNRKHESELKLNSASDNLARLLDIENTLLEQLKDLNRQAKQAARYRSIGERLRKAEASLYYCQLRHFENDLEICNNKLRDKSDAISNVQIAIANLENQKLKILEKIPSLKQVDNQNLDKLQNIKISKIKFEQQINSFQETKKSIENQISQVRGETERENSIILDANKTIDALNEELKDLKKSGFNFTSKFENAQNQTFKFRQTMEDYNNKVSSLNSKIMIMGSQKGEIENEIKEVSKNLSKIKNQLNSFKNEENIKYFQDAKKDIEILKNNILTQKKSKNIKQESLEFINTTLNELYLNKSKIEKEFNNIQTETTTIKNFLIDEDKESLENQIDFTQDMEHPIAAVLGEALLAPIVQNIQSKKEHFWIDDDHYQQKKDTFLQKKLTPILKKIKTSKILSNSLKGVAIVENEKEAYELQKTLSFGQSITTPKGGLWRWDGYVQKPEAKSSFVKRLTFRKKLKNLEEKSMEYDEVLKDINIKISTEEERRNHLKMLLNKEIETISKNQKVLQEYELNVSISKSKIESSKLLINELKLTEINNEKRLSTLNNQVKDFHKLPALQTEELKLRNLFENKKQDFENALAEEKQIKTQEDFRIKRQDEVLIQIKNWDDRKNNSSERLKNLNTKLKLLSEENSKLENLPKKLSEKINLLNIELENYITEQKKSSDNLVIKENELREIEKKQKFENETLSEVKEVKLRIELEQNAVEINMNNLKDKIYEKLEIETKHLLEATGRKSDDFNEIKSENIENLKIRVERLLRERDNLGAVNLRVDQEIKDLNIKLEKMQDEREDLSKAIEKLKTGIYELNKEGRERLQNSFDKTNEKFKYLFNKLFNGGSAELKLIGSDDPLSSGLEIYASPPGKKMQSLSLLSGGEQALTSISLIFAVFLCNPSPLCILDEVDAALDDTNVNLFCNLLEEITKKQSISFLIVTHHRLTMAKMNRLLGVTMEERGISKLLSVDLEKAVEMKEAS